MAESSNKVAEQLIEDAQSSITKAATANVFKESTLPVRHNGKTKTEQGRNRKKNNNKKTIFVIFLYYFWKKKAEFLENKDFVFEEIAWWKSEKIENRNNKVKSGRYALSRSMQFSSYASLKEY